MIENEDNLDFIQRELSEIILEIQSLDISDEPDPEEPQFPSDYDLRDLDGFIEDPDSN